MLHEFSNCLDAIFRMPQWAANTFDDIGDICCSTTLVLSDFCANFSLLIAAQ